MIPEIIIQFTWNNQTDNTFPRADIKCWQNWVPELCIKSNRCLYVLNIHVYEYQYVIDENI